MNLSRSSENRLRRTLQANAGFSLLSATCFIFAAPPVAALTGIQAIPEIQFVGYSLLVFGLFLIGLTARKSRPLPAKVVGGIIVADYGWVFGSIAGLVLWGAQLTSAGWWIVTEISILVGAFATLQARFLRTRAVTAAS